MYEYVVDSVVVHSKSTGYAFYMAQSTEHRVIEDSRIEVCIG